MEKKYVIYWDDTYASGGKKSEVVDESFFSVYNGFEKEEKMAVELLTEVGQTTPMDNNHVWVMRVQ